MAGAGVDTWQGRRSIRRRSGRPSWAGLLVLGLVALAATWQPPAAIPEIAAGGGVEADPAEPAGPVPATAPERAARSLGVEPASRGSSADQRRRPATLYEQAAARYGISSPMLVALHHVESSGIGDSCLANQQGSGAIGPFQFMPATFRAYGVDADGDGRADACGFVDSLFSAANYLHSLGADQDPASPASRRALELYGTDPERVVALAR